MKKKSFMVIGLGRYGTQVALSLCALGHEVLAVDINGARVNAIKDNVTHAVQANVTDEHAVEALGVENFDCVLICIGEDMRVSVMALVLCKEHGAKHVISKAFDALHEKLLYKIGADEVIFPERDSADRLAHALVSDSVFDYINLSNEYSISELQTPDPWVGKTLLQINVRVEYHCAIIALRRDDRFIITIDPNDPLRADDILIVIGSNEDLSYIDSLRAG